MAESYEDLLWGIQAEYNSANIVTNLLPSSSQIYELDLNTRTPKIPQFLSVQYDHKSEIIYFKCDRYFENIDLATTVCVIQYINADGDAGIYWVPYYDVSHYEYDDDVSINKLLIPWAVDGLVTVSAGTVTFNICFYVLNKTEAGEYYYSFKLNTIPVSGNVLHGLELPDEIEDEFIEDTSIVSQIYANLQLVQQNAITYWVDV